MCKVKGEKDYLLRMKGKIVIYSYSDSSFSRKKKPSLLIHHLLHTKLHLSI